MARGGHQPMNRLRTEETPQSPHGREEKNNNEPEIKTDS